MLRDLRCQTATFSYNKSVKACLESFRHSRRPETRNSYFREAGLRIFYYPGSMSVMRF